MKAASQRGGPAAPDLSGRALAVLVGIVGPKIAIILSFPLKDGFTRIHRVFAVGPDLLLWVGLVAPMAIAVSLGSRWLVRSVDLLVLLALVVNCLLAVVTIVAHGYVTVTDPEPLLGVSLSGIARDFATPGRLVALLAMPAVWLLPRLMRGRRLRLACARRWRAALVALGAAYVATSFVTDDQGGIRALSLHPNPLVEYFSPWIFSGRFGALEGEEPAAFQELARELLPAARAAGAREETRGIAALRGTPANVVLVVMESTGMTALDLDGPGAGNAPFLSRIRDHAVFFRRYSTPVPDSRGAIAALLSSRLSVPRGFYPDSEEWLLDLRQTRSLPKVLEEHGTRTALFLSSYYSDWIPGAFYESLGFGTLRDASAVTAVRAARGEPVETLSGRLMEHETVTELLRWADAQCTDQVPFFGVYWGWVDHAPYWPGYDDATEPPEGLPAHERYLRLVRVLDTQVGRIYEALATRDCGRPTVLLVIGDHGEAFGEHPGNRYHGFYLYEENVHVPLFVIDPRLTGWVSDRAASHIDIAPTVLDLMLGDPDPGDDGASPGADRHGSLAYEGRSLLRDTEPWPVFSVLMHGQKAVSIRYGQFKLIEWLTESRLFDTDRDPGEKMDLLARYPQLGAELRRATARWAAHERVQQDRLRAAAAREGGPRSWLSSSRFAPRPRMDQD